MRLNQQFDVVLSLFHVISYQTTNQDLLAAFATVKQHLKPGGSFIFDVWYGPAVLSDRGTVEIEKQTAWLRKSNEELRKSNEELRKSNEELRKSNEELRKSNERLAELESRLDAVLPRSNSSLTPVKPTDKP